MSKGNFLIMKNVEDGDHLLFSVVLFLTSRTKKLPQMPAAVDLWEYTKGVRDGCKLPFLCVPLQ